MYYPFLRGKQFELQALRGVKATIFKNTCPIIEPVTKPTAKVANNIYKDLNTLQIPMILILNPENGDLSQADVETHFVNNLLSGNSRLSLGYIVNQNTNPADLKSFLLSFPTYKKAVIFRSNFLPSLLASIQNEVSANQPDVLVFDATKSGPSTQRAFNGHPNRVLITDGFQKQDRNANYPASSVFISDYGSYKSDGWQGIGDYQTIGDVFTDGGGQPYVVTLHLTQQTSQGLVTNHFSSFTGRSLPGQPALKFTEACSALVTDPATAGITSTGVHAYRGWYASSHFPQLGAAKQASIQHHMELLSSLV